MSKQTEEYNYYNYYMIYKLQQTFITPKFDVKKSTSKAKALRKQRQSKNQQNLDLICSIISLLSQTYKDASSDLQTLKNAIQLWNDQILTLLMHKNEQIMTIRQNTIHIISQDIGLIIEEIKNYLSALAKEYKDKNLQEYLFKYNQCISKLGWFQQPLQEKQQARCSLINRQTQVNESELLLEERCIASSLSNYPYHFGEHAGHGGQKYIHDLLQRNSNLAAMIQEVRGDNQLLRDRIYQLQELVKQLQEHNQLFRKNNRYECISGHPETHHREKGKCNSDLTQPIEVKIKSSDNLYLGYQPLLQILFIQAGMIEKTLK